MTRWQSVRDVGYRLFGYASYPEVARVVERARMDRLTRLTPRELHDLVHAVLIVEQQAASGAVVDVGGNLAGSSVVMCAAKRYDRPMLCFDRFGIDDDVDVLDLRSNAEDTFKRLGYAVDDYAVRLVRGEPADTIPAGDVGPIAVAHVDQAAVSAAVLDALSPHVVPGGRIIVSQPVWQSKNDIDMATAEFVARSVGWRVQRRAAVHLVRL